MEYKYITLNNKLDLMSKVLTNVQERDGSVHRMMFGMNPSTRTFGMEYRRAR